MIRPPTRLFASERAIQGSKVHTAPTCTGRQPTPHVIGLDGEHFASIVRAEQARQFLGLVEGVLGAAIPICAER